MFSSTSCKHCMIKNLNLQSARNIHNVQLGHHNLTADRGSSGHLPMCQEAWYLWMSKWVEDSGFTSEWFQEEMMTSYGTMVDNLAANSSLWSGPPLRYQGKIWTQNIDAKLHLRAKGRAFLWLLKTTSKKLLLSRIRELLRTLKRTEMRNPRWHTYHTPISKRDYEKRHRRCRYG